MPTAQEFIDQFKDTRTLPHIVTRLSKLIANPDSTMRDFENVIKMDPVLVARLLKLVNSPYFGLTQRVDSIGRAVAFLGMKNLNNIAVTDALKSIFQQSSTSGGAFSRKRLWLHCATISISAKMVAERIFGINGDDAYLCGILHDFGLIVEEQIAGDVFYQLFDKVTGQESLIAVENQMLGTNHCKIGYLMTSEWNTAKEIQEAIRNHHNYTEDIEPASLTGILQLAEYISNQLGFSILPDFENSLSPSLADHMEENIDEYKVLLDDLPEEMEKARDMYSSEES